MNTRIDAGGMDLFDPAFAVDPHTAYRRLQATAPVVVHPQGFWLLTRYADVAALQRSGHSVQESALRHIPDFKSDSTRLGDENRMMRGLSLLDSDPPDHSRLRRLVGTPFTRSGVAARMDRISRLADRALDRVAAAGTIDLMHEVAFTMPYEVISEILGVSGVDTERFREHIGTLVLGLEPLAEPATQARIRAANDELTAMTRDLVRRKHSDPGDDLLTALIAAERAGELTGDELVAQVMFVLIAGHETTVNLIGSAVATLLAHPDSIAMVRQRPDLVTNVVEEVLRFEPSVHLMRRVTTAPLDVEGVRIPLGSFVIGVIAAANRDPAFWGGDAATFRPDRPLAHRHLSFGAGIHHCLGAALARAETAAFLSGFIERFPRARLDSLSWNGRRNIRGPESVVVTVS